MRRIALVCLAVVVLASSAGTVASGGPTVADTTALDTVGHTVHYPPASPGSDGPPDASQDGTATDDCAALARNPRPDPDGDPLGWENGCWADERLAVKHGNGLNATELRAVTSRAMARIERLRNLEFVRDVTVDVRAHAPDRPLRDTFRRELQYEALFLLGEDAAYADSLHSVDGPSAAVGRPDEVIVRAANTSSPNLTEAMLVHELVHTLQRQRLRNGSLPDRDSLTADQRAAYVAVIEGGAQYVQHRYERRCRDDDWECGRLRRPPFEGGDPGVFARTTFPYMEGMAFVHDRHQSGGWEAVNALYEAYPDSLPNSSEQVIHPERYPHDTPETRAMRVADRSGDAWQRTDVPGGPDHVSVGELGVFLMFADTGWDDAVDDPLIDRPPFVNRYDEPPVSYAPYDYSHALSEGWAGDRLTRYVGFDAEESAYVWKLRWDSPAEATEFAAGYERLLERRGARPVEGLPNTWRIPDDRPFGDAYHLNRTGRTVVIVNAPTVADLSAVRSTAPAPAAPATTSPTASPTARPTTASATTVPTTAGTTSPTTAARNGGGTPGFGAAASVALLIALLGVAATLDRWRE